VAHASIPKHDNGDDSDDDSDEDSDKDGNEDNDSDNTVLEIKNDGLKNDSTHTIDVDSLTGTGGCDVKELSLWQCFVRQPVQMREVKIPRSSLSGRCDNILQEILSEQNIDAFGALEECD
jgi:hypothetical protein